MHDVNVYVCVWKWRKLREWTTHTDRQTITSMTRGTWAHISRNIFHIAVGMGVFQKKFPRQQAKCVREIAHSNLHGDTSCSVFASHHELTYGTAPSIMFSVRWVKRWLLYHGCMWVVVVLVWKNREKKRDTNVASAGLALVCFLWADNKFDSLCLDCGEVTHTCPRLSTRGLPMSANPSNISESCITRGTSRSINLNSCIAHGWLQLQTHGLSNPSHCLQFGFLHLYGLLLQSCSICLCLQRHLECYFQEKANV